MVVVKKVFRVVELVFALIGLVLVLGFFAVKWGLTNTNGIVDNGFNPADTIDPATLVWNKGEEWEALSTALTKDEATIYQASRETGVPARLIVAMIVPEQLRLFHSEREVFKQIFGPLKILGNQTQFSWGVAGLKQETAKQIEENLKATSSPYYLGVGYEKMLDFKTNNPDEERFNRIADEHDHYYSYLYTALYLKQVMTQWEKSNFPIANKPEILGTLFNIGFAHSEPKANPQVGGSQIDIGSKTYSFGGLAYEFYYSPELIETFPR
jgi:hypothetical protein